MKSFVHASVLAAVLMLAGCATSQNVLLAKQDPAPVITVAQAPGAGNSPEMDAALRSALVRNGYTVRAALPEGSRKSEEVDAIISYEDVWRWDIVMYLQSIAIKMFDARTGDLLITGDWKNSAFHGFQNEKTVVNQLVDDMSSKLRAAVVERPAPEVAEAVSGVDAAVVESEQ